MNPNPTPWWFITLLVLAAFPVLSTPTIYSATEPDSQARLLAWCYPIYVVLSVGCAWKCYPDRRALAWILLILLVLTDAAMWLLAA